MIVLKYIHKLKKNSLLYTQNKNLFFNKENYIKEIFDNKQIEFLF